MKNSLPEITIIKDSREQKGWDFPPEDKSPGKIRILGTIIECLDCGDYSIKDAKDLIRIERKYGISELFGNMTPKENKLRFEREMEKLSNIKHKYILVETNLSNDLLSLSVPQFRSGPPCSIVLKWLNEIEFEYNVNIKFVGECGKRYAKWIFEQIARKYL